MMVILYYSYETFLGEWIQFFFKKSCFSFYTQKSNLFLERKGLGVNSLAQHKNASIEALRFLSTFFVLKFFFFLLQCFFSKKFLRAMNNRQRILFSSW